MKSGKLYRNKKYQQKGRNYKKEPYKYSGAEKNNTWNKFTKGVKQ